MTEFNMTQEMAADRIGKSRSAIANTLRLLTLDEGVISLIEQGRLSAGHARTLVVVTDKQQQYKLALKACDNKMNVRDMEKAVKEYLNPKPKKDAKSERSLELEELVNNMQRAFATKVSAVGNGNKGRIYVDYYTKDDLDRMCALVDNWMQIKFTEDEN